MLTSLSQTMMLAFEVYAEAGDMATLQTSPVAFARFPCLSVHLQHHVQIAQKLCCG
jgi:hypothetical protein